METITRSKIVVSLGVLTASLLLLVLLSPSSQPETFLRIAFQGHSNSVDGMVSILRLSNPGKPAMLLDPFCTIYWTNDLGVEEYKFIEHSLGNATIYPSKSHLVVIAVPNEVKIWESSFTYTLKLNWWNEAQRRFPSWIAKSSELGDSLYGSNGPKITNAIVASYIASLSEIPSRTITTPPTNASASPTPPAPTGSINTTPSAR